MSLPTVIVFDVNETLSDMQPLREEFAATGLDGQLDAWFAGLLRDGFALTVVGENPSFAELAKESLWVRLSAAGSSSREAVDRVMSRFMALGLHGDVVKGVRALRESGVRLVTLSNGATAVADGLLERAEVRDAFETLLSVSDAPAWKPASAAYEYALDACSVHAGDAMLVAVHPWDIDGAARAGLRTGWLNRSGAPYPAYFRAAEVQAPDLVSLAGTLR